MRITRRTFLATSLGTGVLALVGAYRWRKRAAPDLIIAILTRRVGYLHVDPETFTSFAQMYVARRQRSQRQLTDVSVLAGPLRYWSPYSWLAQGHAYRRLEDSVVSHYLLSTDFFQHGADESRPVTYVAFYDPATTVCRNPFAQPVEADARASALALPTPAVTSSSATARRARS
jgi:hypothetical protein